MNWHRTDKIEYLMLYQNEYAVQSTIHSVSESAFKNQSIVGSYISDINTTMNLTTYDNDTINNLFPPAIFNEPKEFIFDRKEVRIIFITLYTLVFCCCFFGNLLVILVVTLSRRLRSITNFFLANLAVADFCVGIFCVLQNLSIYLIPSWVFGEFLCKMYQFVHSLSYTASIFILVVICMERYFAIIHPITCKQILTSKRLRLVIVLVWLTSALYSTPKFIFMNTITNTIGNETEIYCVPMRTKFDSETFDMLNFVLLYIVPLLIMTILYSRIAISLWKSSKGLGRNMQMKSTPMASSGSGNAFCRHPSKYEKRTLGTTESEVSMESDKNGVTTWRTHSVHNQRHHNHHNQHGQLSSHSSNNVLRARRGVVRMLMVVVLTFALCNLPLHARKMWQNWSDDYRGDSNFTALFTPLTFLVTYFNSGVNPLLYAFLSRNFRKGMSELLICSLKQNKSKALNKRTVTHVSKLSSVVISNNDNDNSINKMDQLNNITEHNTSCIESISVH